MLGGVKELSEEVKKNRKKIKYVLFHENNDFYAELIKIPSKTGEKINGEEMFETAFVQFFYKTSEIKLIDSIDLGTKILMPLPSDDPYLRVYHDIPTEATEYDSEFLLFNDIKSFIHKWVDIGDRNELVCALYVMLTWCYDCFDEIPYLHITGDLGSGKSRLGIDILRPLCFRPFATIGASSIASVFRIMETVRGTFILDEFDLKQSDKTSEVIQLLNSGYKKNIPIARVESHESKGYKPEIFNGFCPKILISRNSVRDDALESRSFQIYMHEMKREVPYVINGRELEAEALPLRNKLLMWRFRHKHKNVEEKDLSFTTLNISSRLKELFLIASAVLDDAELKIALKEFALEIQKKNAVRRGESTEGEIAEALWIILNRDQSIRNSYLLTLSEVLEQVNIGRDKKLSKVWFGRLLRESFGLETIRKGHDRTVKILLPLKAANDIFVKYGLEPIVVPAGADLLMDTEETLNL